MPQPVADRNLLFGILALQMDFISRDQLLTAMQAWVFDKSKSLGEILCAQKALDKEHSTLLDALVQKHLAKHNNDAEKSLAAVNPAGNLRRDLERIADVDVQASLGHLSVAPRQQDPYATIMPTPSMVVPGGSLRFRIVRPHARGGLGEVFVALDEELHREVALKEIQDRQADNQESRARFMLEAEITGGLEHPGIVPVYGLGTYPDGRPYYAMRFIRGDSLKDAIERFHKYESTLSAGERALQLRNLLGRFIDVCNAIAYAHSRGILHRDLKPGNIMLGKYGETLVVDWGLAKPVGHLNEEKTVHEPGEGSLVPSSLSGTSATLIGSAVGTPQYMSPEQAAGKLEQLGPASDVYSLGATLYCLLTGVSPVGGNDVGDMLRRVERGDFQKPSQVVRGVPPALEAVCLKAMALKPTDRYPTPRELADDIEHWLADEPVSAYPEPWTVKARRWVNRNMTLVASIASAIIVGVVGLIVTIILLTAANERERLAKQEALTNFKKAEENFQLAKQAVDQYHTKVSEDDLLQEPGMQPLRKKLLESASEFYKKFVAERGDDPNLRGESAKALFRLAQITGDIGSKTEAIDLHKKAAAVFETLAATPDKSDFRADQAACYHHLGRLYRTIDKLKQSDEYYDKAEKTWETLVTANPKDSRYQAGLARTLMGIGNARLSASRPAEAQPMYEKSRAAWQELAKTNRATGDYQREVGVNYSNLGMIYQDQAGKEKNAEKSLRTAWGIQKKLVDDAPNIGKYQNDFAVTNYLLAKSLVRTTDRKADAKAYFQEAADRWQTLINQQPAVLDYQKRAAEAYLALATLERIERDWTAAEATCRKALAVQRKLAERYKDDEDFQVGLAGGLYALGEICSANKQDDRSKEAEPAFEEAIAIQKKLATKPNPPPYRLRDLAKSFNGLGVFHMNHGQEQKATTAFKNAVTQWESLVTINPASDEFALGLSDSCFNLGNMARLAARPKDAEAWFTRAADCFDLKNTALLADPRVQLKLSNAYWMRADTLTKLRSFDDALKDWDRALRYAKDDMKFAIRLPRAAALARAGKHAEAVKEANEMIALARGGEAYFRFVRVYALAATAAKDDQNSSDEYAMQGIKALTKAVEAGYFKSAANLTRLQDDPEFQVLRDRPEFKKLVNDLKMQ